MTSHNRPHEKHSETQHPLFRGTYNEMLHFARIILLQLLCISHIWRSNALSLSKRVRNEIGSYTLGAITVLTPFHAGAIPSAEVVKIDVDTPKLIEIAKTNKDATVDLIKQLSGAISISKPTDLFNFVRDAAAGDILAEINGSPIDISLMVKKGIIDLAANTEVGDISLTFSSPFIPPLPLLEKRIPTVTATPMEPLKATDTLSEERLPLETALTKSFWDAEFINGYSNKQVAGWGSLGLGAIYGASYAYYERSIAEEEAKAAEKKKAAAEKARKKTPSTQPASVSNSSSESASSSDPKDDVVQKSNAGSNTFGTENESKTQTVPVLDAKQQEKKDTPTASDADEYSIPRSASKTDDTEDPKVESKRRKRRFWQLWKRA